MAYFDHHASTPLAPEALEAMLRWLSGGYGNPSSVHQAGREARKAVEAARRQVATAIGASPDEIVFTSGGTESDNLAVRGAALAARDADPARISVAFTAAEHPAVREAARALAPLGFVPRELPVDADGLPRRGTADLIDATTAVVSIIYASNETGAICDELPRLAEAARKRGAIVHSDAVQAAGKIPLDVGALGIDLLSLTGHKFGGPRGAGALWVRRGVRLVPQLAGGGQERGRRAGTENVAAIAGLGAALRAATEREAAEAARLSRLRDRFERELSALVPDVRFHATSGAATRRLPTVSSAAFPGVDGETLLVALDLEGIQASSGSACASGTSSPSHVLLACGLPAETVRATLRFSFGRTTSEEEVDALLAALPRLPSRARAASGVASQSPGAL